VALGEDLKRGVRNIKEVVIFDRKEELTEEVVLARIKATVVRIDALMKHQKRIGAAGEKQPQSNPLQNQGPRRAAHRWLIAREKVFVSRIVRELKYTPLSASGCWTKSTRPLTPCALLERQVRSLDQKFEASKSEELKKEYRSSRRTAAPTWKRSKTTRAC